MKRLIRGLCLLAIGSVVACVTINIYFPAEEIRGVADRIVDEVYGEPDKPVDKVPAKPGSSFFRVFEPTVAYAAQDLDVTTPEIRAIKADMTARFDQLVPFLNSGQAGITSDGLLEIRTAEGLGMKERAELTRLIKAENQDRLRLYKEIATANNFPDKVDEIQAIFASSWRDKAHKGWYVQGDKGDWKVK
jgi:uncharacterized protein YdbL (DUF1318 family)